MKNNWHNQSMKEVLYGYPDNKKIMTDEISIAKIEILEKLDNEITDSLLIDALSKMTIHDIITDHIEQIKKDATKKITKRRDQNERNIHTNDVFQHKQDK